MPISPDTNFEASKMIFAGTGKFCNTGRPTPIYPTDNSGRLGRLPGYGPLHRNLKSNSTAHILRAVRDRQASKSVVIACGHN